MNVTGSRRIKVVLVVNDFLVGGVQWLMIDLLKRVDPERFDLSLITLFRFEGKKTLFENLPEGAAVYPLSFRSAYDLSSWGTLFRLLKRLDPDVVFSNLFLSNTIIRLMKPFFRYRVISAEHNTYTEKPRFHQFLDRVLALFSARILAVSNSVAAFTARQEHIRPDKFVVINPGVDLAALRARGAASDPAKTRRALGLAPRERVIVNVSRVVPQKNHRLLLEGFAHFVPYHPEYRLVIVGGGSQFEKTRAYARELGLGDRALLVGFQDDIFSFLAIGDFYVSTSLIEGFGVAHLEALACGIPVLSTKTAGPDEMIEEGKNGFFITDSTPEAVADGMERMCKEDLARMSRAARDSAERYSIERTVRAYEDLFAMTARVPL